jgi:hypothetical protein
VKHRFTSKETVMASQHMPLQPRSHSYTAAFDELDLSWNWDPATYGDGRAGLRAYVERELPHLLRVYDAEFLVDAVESTRARLSAR